MMNLIEQAVLHPTFGEGIIQAQTDTTIAVKFAQTEKKFMYPQAFHTHLSLRDKVLMNAVARELKQQMDQLEEEAIQKEEVRLENVKKQQLLMEYERLTNNHKLHAESQVVFSVDEDEQQQVFEQWTIYAGDVKSGAKKGLPNKGTRIHRNSAILLTTCPTEDEKDRIITGLFMVHPHYIGKLDAEGQIPAHAQHRLQLTVEEAAQLPFWLYYHNKKAPTKVAWNTGKYRYFENEWTAQILQSIYQIKTDALEKEQVAQFLRYFCKMNQISMTDIQPPQGILA